MLDPNNAVKSTYQRKLVLFAVVALSVTAIMMIRSGYIIDTAPLQSKEKVLKTDLRVMRDAIDNYTLDKQEQPDSLQDLVDANYLRSIPVDPITYRRDWIVEFGDMQVSTDSVAKRIMTVHSSSTKTSRDGTPYNTW